MSWVNIEEMPIVKDVLQEAAIKIKASTGVSVRLKIAAFINISDEIKVILQELVCRAFNVSWEQIKSKTRKGYNVTDARHVYMYLSYSHLKRSLTETGMDCGMRDHTTVLSAVKKIKGFIDIGDPIAQIIDRIKENMPV